MLAEPSTFSRTNGFVLLSFTLGRQVETSVREVINILMEKLCPIS